MFLSWLVFFELRRIVSRYVCQLRLWMWRCLCACMWFRIYLISIKYETISFFRAISGYFYIQTKKIRNKWYLSATTELLSIVSSTTTATTGNWQEKSVTKSQNFVVYVCVVYGVYATIQHMSDTDTISSYYRKTCFALEIHPGVAVQIVVMCVRYTTLWKRRDMFIFPTY